MEIETILSRDRTFCRVQATSKKKAIEAAAELIAKQDENLRAEDVYSRLMSREKIGSTGLGDGIALPHCRLECPRIMGALITLEAPIDFESVDDEPVEIMFIILVPEEETEQHLKTLAMLVKYFESPGYKQSLLDARDTEELYLRAISTHTTTGIIARQNP